MSKTIAIRLNDLQEKELEEIKERITNDSKFPKYYSTSEIVKMCIKLVHTKYEQITK